MSNRWNIIFIATIFNLLFEYSLRGINNLFIQPVLLFVLFSIYFTLFVMVEDLIVRFKLKDYQLIILAFFYGTIYNAYTSGIVFLKPTVAGIDLYFLILINVFWWGSVQAIITFYLANVIAKRNWNHSLLSKKGWIICLFINIATVLLFKASGKIPHGTPQGNFTILVIAAISLVAFIVSMKGNSQKPNMFTPSRFLNIITFLTVTVFAFCGIFLIHDPVLSGTSHVNALSLTVISRYTFILGIVLLVYRLKTKKQISV